MTTSRLLLSLAAGAVSLGLAFAPSASFADDMKKGMSKSNMEKSSMSKDGMKKDAMGSGMKKNGMKKDGMKK